MRKENIYYLLSALIGLISILILSSTRNYSIFFILLIASAIFLLLAIYEDTDNIEF